MENATASKCIEIIGRRTPLTYNEIRLLQRIINDIRIEFELLGAVDQTDQEERRGAPPKEWLW